jgi:hypothetical protein
MYARVATFEGADPATQRSMIEEIRNQASDGPPEGVPAKEFLMLTDGAGKGIAIMLFDTEADCKAGDETLNGMEPPVPGGLGKRTSVELLEVPLHLTL